MIYTAPKYLQGELGMSSMCYVMPPTVRRMGNKYWPKFFTDRMPFLPPNQQHQSTEGNYYYFIILYYFIF